MRLAFGISEDAFKLKSHELIAIFLLLQSFLYLPFVIYPFILMEMQRIALITQTGNFSKNKLLSFLIFMCINLKTFFNLTIYGMHKIHIFG